MDGSPSGINWDNMGNNGRMTLIIGMVKDKVTKIWPKSRKINFCENEVRKVATKQHKINKRLKSVIYVK